MNVNLVKLLPGAMAAEPINGLAAANVGASPWRPASRSQLDGKWVSPPLSTSTSFECVIFFSAFAYSVRWIPDVMSREKMPQRKNNPGQNAVVLFCIWEKCRYVR